MNKKDFQGQYAYSVAKYNIKLLVIWLNWLRENNVYNNTKIIIASDHGESSDKKLTERFPSIPNGFGRTNALLLVKDFNDLGNELDIDNRFMSNADIPSIIASSLDYPHLLTLDKDPRKKDTSNRTLPIYRATNMNRQNNSDENFEIIDSYKVTNNLFDPKNWEKQER